MANLTDFEQFLEDLGAFESGINTTQQYGPHDLDWLMVFDSTKGNVDRNSVDLTNPDDLASLQYHVHNTLGFLGKYQFGEPLLIDLGYYNPAPGGFYGSTATNEWQGTWTGKNGVYSKEDFMTNVQELAIREAFAMNMSVIEQRLAQAGHTIDDFLGQEFTYTRLGEQHVATVTMSGILASAHLQGPGGVANLLLNNVASSDEYGTNILFYMDSFGGHATPFGTAADDHLVGSDITETFQGGVGDNVYDTGGGYDKIIIADNPNASDIINDFDVQQDVISLSNLGITYADLNIVNNANGDAQINLADNQKIILQGVNAGQLSADNFVEGPYKMSWNANSGDTVIDNFNLRHDIIDLNYAFANNNLAIYEENGNAVIEVVGNNQRMILEGIALDDLNAFHFLKAPIGFGEYFFSDGANNEPPPVDNTPPTNEEPPTTDPTPTIPPADQEGVYSFTWNWGANEVIQNFDPDVNVVNLQSFWSNYGAIDIYDSANGAVIDLTGINNQTITLAGVDVADLNASNIVGLTGNFADALADGSSVPPVDDGEDDEPVDDPVDDPVDNTPPPDNSGGNDQSGQSDVYSYTWNWGSHPVINGFDANNDVIDLQGFWTNYNSFDIYDNSSGDAVIDLTGLNNQTITIAGVSADELSADNIRGVLGNFSDALGSSAPPSSGGDGDGGVDIPADPASQDVFKYTWNWGAREVISDFDAGHDVIDLKSFWTTPDQVQVYDDGQGNAVIDLSNLNNQTITVMDTSVHDLQSHDSIVF